MTRTIAITGVSSGIGRATARLLRSQGARIIGFDRNPPKDAIDAFHPVDMADQSAIEAAVRACEGPIHGLCNIAGLPPTAGKHDVLMVNFFGLRHFVEQITGKLADGGAIVSLASLAGTSWRDEIETVRSGIATAIGDAPAWVARQVIDDARSYHLSKELLIGWTIAAHDRWKSRGIRLNTVSPGPVDTPILSDFIKTLGKRAEEDLKVNRAGQADEIARVLAFLCSPEATWINGADIAVDGGAGAAMWRGTVGL